MSIKALRKIQLGLESTAGTAVAATAIWRGTGVMADNREVTFPEEDVANIMGYGRTYIPKLEGAISFDETPATFAQLPYILAAGIEDVVTGAADGAGSGKIYQYDFPTTAANSIKTYTLEAGDDTQAEEMEYSFVESLTISGAAGEAIMMQANWVGRQVTNTTFTGSLSIPTVEEILFSKAKLYIDGTGTYPATTQITGSFLSFELSVTTGWKARYTGEGDLYFTSAKLTRPEITLNIRFEHDSNATTEKTSWRNETARAVQIQALGSALGTAGTTYTYKTLIIDAVGMWETISPMDDDDGNDVIDATLRVRDNATAGAAGKIIVVNELSSLT